MCAVVRGFSFVEIYKELFLGDYLITVQYLKTPDAVYTFLWLLIAVSKKWVSPGLLNSPRKDNAMKEFARIRIKYCLWRRGDKG